MEHYRLPYDGCKAIEEKVVAMQSPSENDIIEQYLARVENYKEVTMLDIEKRELSRQAHSIYMKGNKLYVGTWEGDVFVYKNSVYVERFKVADNRVVKIEGHRDSIIVVHSSGDMACMENRQGVVHKIEGYINGVVHPYNPWLISQTEEGMHVFDFSQGKTVYKGFFEESVSVFAVHPAGSCLLAMENTAKLIDLRTMKSSLEMENIKSVRAGIFHTLCAEMMISSKKRIKNIDIRTMTHINQVKTKATATVMHEYKSALFYSGPGLYIRGICPVKGSSLFVQEKEARLMASSGAKMAFVGPDRTVHILQA